MSGLVLVTGGTGKTGRRVAQQLSAAGAEVRVAARGGPQPFDWSNPDTWDAALDGVSAAYLVPPPLAGDVSAFFFCSSIAFFCTASRSLTVFCRPATVLFKPSICRLAASSFC